MQKIHFVHPYEWASMMLDPEFVNTVRFKNNDYESVQFDFNEIRYRVIARSDDDVAYVVNPRMDIPDWVIEKLELMPEDLPK